MAELEVTLEQSGSDVLIHAVGPVDSTTATSLQEPLLRAAESPGGALRLDLAQVSYLSSAGMRALLLAAVDDDQFFLDALTRRLEARSTLRHIEVEFAPARYETNANIGAERLDDILTTLMEGMAGIGVKHIAIATQVTSGHVEIRLSSRERMDPAAFDKRRLDLYNRTLGWLGGSLECGQTNGSAEFVRLPTLSSV